VFKAFNMNDGEFVAVKEVDLAELEPGARTKVLREISILRQLSHENIVKYIDCHQEDNALYVIMEFIEAGSIQVSEKK
jgi:serine/threonine protein kinase